MATLAQQRLAVPVTKTAMSMTDARRQLAAKPRSYGLAPQPGVMQPPTPQMRNTAGQMGPAVGLGAQAGQLDRENVKAGMAGQRQQGLDRSPGQYMQSLLDRGWTPEQAKARTQQFNQQQQIAQRQQQPNAQADFLKKQQFEQQQVNQRRMFDLKMDQERQKAQQAMFQQQMFQEQGMNSRDTVPAMLTPGERVLTPQETQAFHQSPYAPQILGVDGGPTFQQQLMAQQRLVPVQQFAYGGIVPLHYAEGGIVPTTGIPTPTAPTMAVARPVTGVQSGLIGRQPQAPLPTGGTPPIIPTSPQPPPTVGPGVTPYRTDWAGLRQEIGAFGQAPTLDDSTMARMRAIESQKLGNLYRGQLSELGASAASSGAGLYGGDLAGIAAGFAAQRGQQEAELGLKYNVAALDQKREDFYKQFGAAQSLAMQRESQNFSKEEAELDRRWRSGEALSDREWKTLEAAKERIQQTNERLGSQGFQTGERIGTQLFTAEESTKQRALITDENAKDRLAQMALAEKNIAAQKAALEAQLTQARSENNLDRVQQLTVQRNELEQQDQSLRQQNDQYLLDFGLRRDVFDRGMVEFDLTRGDQVGQFAQNLDLQNRQLTESGRVANMDDATVRYVAQLEDRLKRDIYAAQIDPSNLQTLLSTIGSIAAIPGLGELVFGEGGLAREGLKKIFGGGSDELVDDGTGNFVPKSGTGGLGWEGGLTGAPTGLGTVGTAALGAGGAALLITSFNDPTSLGRTAQAIAGGAALGSVIPGVGTLIGGVVGGLTSVFGQSGRDLSQDVFTKGFDEAYKKLESSGALNYDVNNPNSLTQPANRLGLALAFKQAWTEYAKPGVGSIEVSGPDIERMQRLGLVAQIGGTQGGAAKAFLIDDPRVLAMAGGGDISQYFDIIVDDKMVDRTHETTGGSLAQLIAGGTVRITDKVTGQVIDLNNPEQLQQIAARNLGTPTTTSPTTTPPKQAVA